MSKTRRKWIALIRAIGPVTHKKMSMADLRKSCELAGLHDVSTYIATGNLLFTSTLEKSRLRGLLAEILANFELDNEVVLRRPSDLQTVVSAAPFPDGAKTRPDRLGVTFLDQRPSKSGVLALAARSGPELVLALNRELCIDHGEGVGGTSLTPAVIERHLGQRGTARNWNTVVKLLERSYR